MRLRAEVGQDVSRLWLFWFLCEITRSFGAERHLRARACDVSIRARHSGDGVVEITAGFKSPDAVLPPRF